MQPISSWPSAERPREKLLSRGPQALSDAELLAIFIRTGGNGRTAVDIARELLAEHGDLVAVLGCEQRRFCATPGLGMTKYAQLQAALELGRRYVAEELSTGEVISSPQATRRFLVSRLRGYRHEVFACLFLDNRHRVLGFEELFTGTINGASVYPREVVKKALAYNAAAVIFSHNHPSGVAEPSEADRAITRRLSDALALVEIRVLDHIIVGGSETVSFSERGLV